MERERERGVSDLCVLCMTVCVCALCLWDSAFPWSHPEDRRGNQNPALSRFASL